MAEWTKTLEALFPRPRCRILTAVFAEPGKWWGLGDLADHLELPPRCLRRELSTLAAGGVLLYRRSKTRSYFRANPGCAFYNELQAMAAKCASLKGAGGAETILVVDNEPATLKIARILLESWGYKVFEARDAEEAIRIFEHDHPQIRLLLTDVVMPGMSGPELGEKLQDAKPGLKVLYMSGYPNDELMRKRLAFLPKPFNPAGLARKIREELDKL